MLTILLGLWPFMEQGNKPIQDSSHLCLFFCEATV